MTLTNWLRELCGFYVAFTLSATSLSKARTWKRTIHGVRAEKVFADRSATLVVGGLVLVEMGLAIVLAAGLTPLVVGTMTATLFLAFGAYKTAVAKRSGIVSCTCTGSTIALEATRTTVLATVLVSIVQAAVVILWAALPVSSPHEISITSAIAVLLPYVVLLVGSYRANEVDNQHPLEDEHIHSSKPKQSDTSIGADN